MLLRDLLRQKHKKIATVVALSYLMLSTAFASGSVLHVRKGEKLIIGSDKVSMLVDEWIMEDGSTIKINIPKWKVQAKKAVFGRNVIIDAKGADGVSNVGHAQPPQTGEATGWNSTGGSGQTGKSGGDGQPGAEIEIIVGLEKVDDFMIITSGGAGGAGGNGGKGQKGGRGHCYMPSVRGGKGGKGGMGGRGGNGGNGGNVTFRYWVPNLTDAAPGDSALPGLRIVSTGGLRGVGGRGGAGGDGGTGVPRCDIFGGRGDGPRGADGNNGQHGSDAKDGIVIIRPIPSPR